MYACTCNGRPWVQLAINVLVGIECFKSSNWTCCHHKHYPSTTIFEGGGHLELHIRIFSTFFSLLIELLIIDMA